MKSSDREREQMLLFCGEIHEDDGIDPREFFKSGRTQKMEDRKSKQLCRQVAQTLEQVLSGETGDDLLRRLRVASVVAAPDSSRLLVTLCTERNESDCGRALIEARVKRFASRLRCEVSAAITRRKTPLLVFDVIHYEELRQASREEARA